MTIEFLPTELTNVIRFPVEKRTAASIALVRALAPDVADVKRVTEGMLQRMDQTARDYAHTETALFIAERYASLPNSLREARLNALMEHHARAAIDACRAAEAAGLRCARAQHAWLDAHNGSGRNLPLLLQTAGERLDEAAHLLIEAHRRCEEAEGVHDAIATARRTDFWSPAKMAETTDWLIAAGEADAKRRAASAR